VAEIEAAFTVAIVDGGLKGAQHLNDVLLRKSTSTLQVNELVGALPHRSHNSSTLTPAIACAVDEARVIQLHLQMALQLKAAAPKEGRQGG